MDTATTIATSGIRETSMANGDETPSEKPVMEPFPDKTGTGWHVVIRYHAGHERLIEGFSNKSEAVDWIIANSDEVEE